MITYPRFARSLLFILVSRFGVPTLSVAQSDNFELKPMWTQRASFGEIGLSSEARVSGKFACVAALLICLFGGDLAGATPITTLFTVTAVSGPLSGSTASGQFTFDSSAIVFEGFNNTAGLLTDLTFAWNGFNYDEANANTGGLGWDAEGTLTSFLFGNNCSGDTCTILSGSNYWSISSSFDFGYASPVVAGIYDGTLTFTTPRGPGAPVPEPSSLLLVTAGLAMTVGRRLRPRRTPW